MIPHREQISVHERDLLHIGGAERIDTFLSFRNKNGQEDVMSDVSDFAQKPTAIVGTQSADDLVSGRVVLMQIAILVVTLIVVALVAGHKHI